MDARDLLEELNRGTGNRSFGGGDDRMGWYKPVDGTQEVRLVTFGPENRLYFPFPLHRYNRRETSVCPKMFDQNVVCPDCEETDALFAEATDESVKRAKQLRARLQAWLAVVPMGPNDKRQAMIWERSNYAVRTFLARMANVVGWTDEDGQFLDEPWRPRKPQSDAAPEEVAAYEEAAAQYDADMARYLDLVSEGMKVCIGTTGARNLVIVKDSKKSFAEMYKFKFTAKPGEDIEIPEVQDLREVFFRVKGLTEDGASAKGQPQVRGRPSPE